MIISVTHTVGHIIIMSQSHTRKASLTQPNTQGSLCVTLTNYAHSPGPWPPGSFISSLCLVSQLTRHISAQNVSSLFTVVRHHNHNQRASHSLSLTVTLDTVVCVDCPDSVCRVKGVVSISRSWMLAMSGSTISAFIFHSHIQLLLASARRRTCLMRAPVRVRGLATTVRCPRERAARRRVTG